MSTVQMDADFHFRAALIKIENLLSDSERKRLHFSFGEDIPRRLQSDGSIDEAIEVLQILLNQLKISKDDCGYLICGLKAIQRPDCAQRLLDYKKLISVVPLVEPRQNQNATTTELPPSTSKIWVAQTLAAMDEEDDDSMNLPKETELVHIGFNPPDPDPLDINNIDLTPFEDSSCPWTEEFSKSLNLKYHPRAYQIEIIRDAIRSGNTIVCLRTGSGKTFIASILIKYHFIKRQKANSDAKFLALFFVPRKAIRLQQAKAINNIENLRVRICEDDQTIDKLLNNHVVVSTPQKFVNCLKKQTMYLSQVDLMIFDECHNTSGGNPYCEIMKFYLCPSRKQNTTDKPLIIGLTATISAKDSYEKKESVDKNLVSICSKLACETISTVCDSNNIEEINREISRPKNDQFEYVSKVQYNSYFDEYLSMFKALIDLIKRHLTNHESLDGQEIGSSGFISQLILLKRTFERKGEVDNTIISEYLLLLTKKYSALKDLPFDMVLKHILKEIKEHFKGYTESQAMNNLLYERCKTEIEIILNKHAENPTTNSKLDKLVTLLKRYASTDNKGLVLVQKTFYAKTLDDYLNRHPELEGIVRSTWLVGQNSSDFSLTIHEQEERLRKFRENECDVLIATDIVQEGLDIPTCSYVIRYEFVSDEIGTIQSRGRARAQDSSYYLITEENSINHQREKNNKCREDDMEEAIKQWPKIDKAIFVRDVVNKTKSLITTWDKEITDELQQKARLQKIGKKTGWICCRRCSRRLGRLEWLKKRNSTYFVNQPEFLTDNDCQLESTFKNFQENLIMGEVKCTCGNSLGGCQKFTDRPDLSILCALKCKQIKFLIENCENYVEFPQWNKNNCFDVEELEEI